MSEDVRVSSITKPKPEGNGVGPLAKFIAEADGVVSPVQWTPKGERAGFIAELLSENN